MRRRNREINVFSISALDLFASAMGAFILIAVVLFPYYLRASRTQVEVREIDVVFVIDTTQSMGAAIDQLRSELVGIVAVLEHISPDVRVGFVAYKAEERENDYVLIEQPLISTREGGLGRLQEWVNRLHPQGGGIEILADALSRAAAMAWQQDRTRVIVLIADEPGGSGTLPQAIAVARRFGRGNQRHKVSAYLAPEALDPRYSRRQVQVLREQRRIAERWLQAIAEAGTGVFVRPDEGGLASVTLLSVLEHPDRANP